jgi:formylmethanofuran dehydrogenase subunit B
MGMSASTSSHGPGRTMPDAWTCPFCTLLCDDVGITLDPAPSLTGSNCPRARAALANFASDVHAATPLIDGQPVSEAEAVAEAAARLSAAQLPLFGGLATDVAGMRALYTLANRRGAIFDHAHGAAMLPSLRSLQDRGGFSSTLAEVRNRADVILCIDTQPSFKHPEFFRRCGLGETGQADKPATRSVVFLGGPADATASNHAGVTVSEVPFQNDLFHSLAVLNTLCRAKPPAHIEFASPALRALAEQLLAARYVALVFTPSNLAAKDHEHAALLVEHIHHLTKALNRTTRAGALSLGGDDGGNTANYVMTWLSGLPLRTAVQPTGLEHDPHRYDTSWLLANHAVDAVLWVASLGPDLPPPDTRLPLVVLGHPALEAHMRAQTSVFLPVSTPGIGSAGHMFRTDGGVVLPLTPVRPDSLPTVATLANRIQQALDVPTAHAEGAA